MKVGFYQFDPVFGEVKKNLDSVMNRLSEVECDLLVLPELALSGYQFTSQDEVSSLAESVPDGPTTQGFIELAKRRSMHVVVGLPEQVGNQCYNSAILVGPTGFIGLYRKAHLFFEETLFFSPGNTGLEIWDIGMAKVGILICFDWIYPEAARTLALKGADVLAHPSNLVLPHCPDAMVTRCLENRVFSVTANRVGQESRGGKQPLTFIGKSEVVSPGGLIVHRASSREEELTIVDIDVHEARDKSINPYNDIFRDRHPEFYVC